jgi:DNA-binding transcriptional LysR family regulator
MQELHKSSAGFFAAVKVADAGSFSEAARQLNITPAAVAKSIAQLEAQLGVRLFNRTTRQLSLTSEGSRVVVHARAAMQALAEAGSVTHSGGHLRGLVRINCATGYGRKFVLPLLPRIQSAHPELHLELNLSDLNIDLIKEGFDIGIRGASSPPLGMVARRIAKFANVLVASPEYLSAHGTPQDWTELPRHRRIGVRFPSGRVSQWSFKKGAGLHSLEGEPTLLLSAPELAVDAAALHLGIAQVGLHHAHEAIQAGKVIEVLKRQHVAQAIEIAIFYPHRDGQAPRVRAVVDMLVAGLQKGVQG